MTGNFSNALLVKGFKTGFEQGDQQSQTPVTDKWDFADVIWILMKELGLTFEQVLDLPEIQNLIHKEMENELRESLKELEKDPDGFW